MAPALTRIGCAALLSLASASVCWADSLASSASSAGSASLGSISDSSKGSSKSSDGGKKVAAGDYRVLEVAALANKPGMLQLRLQATAQSGEDGALWLTLPRQALIARDVMAGDLLNASPRPYGIAFAHADTRTAFFLLLADDWRGGIDPQLVTP
jgi:hypothetical protein